MPDPHPAPAGVSGTLGQRSPQGLTVDHGPVVTSHGEWDCRESDYEDGDSFTTPWWTAVHKVTQESKLLHLSRFSFAMTPERFAWLVDNGFPRHPRGNWDNASIDEAMKGEPA